MLLTSSWGLEVSWNCNWSPDYVAQVRMEVSKGEHHGILSPQGLAPNLPEFHDFELATLIQRHT